MGRETAIGKTEGVLARLHDGWLCTRPFWVYLPVLVLLLVWAGPQAGTGATLGLVLLGLLAWTLVEWVLHWSMHVPTRSRLFRQFQESAHLRHHREPDDLARSVVTLRGSVPLAVLFGALSLSAFRTAVPAAAFFAGLLLGYCFYEFVHLATHARRRIPGLAWLEQYHAQHHARHWNRTFGVTCPLWDFVFGTLPRRRA